MKSSFFPSIVFGGLLSFLFYGAVNKGLITQPLIVRYFASHPIEYVITIVFFVGIAILLVKYLTLLSQRQLLSKSPILVPSPQPVPITHIDSDYETVLEHEKKNGVSLLSERIKTHLDYIRRNNSALHLDTELRTRAESAAAKTDTDYGLIRLILWAIPMIGFLGTVIGITTALENLDLNAMSESSKELAAGLALAFDTTGLAIALAVALFFVQFVVHREEMNLLEEVDMFTEKELGGRFVQEKPEDKTPDENKDVLSAIQTMLEAIIGTLEQTTLRQTEAWTECLDSAEERYAQLTERNAQVFTASLSTALKDGMKVHADSLAEAEAQYSGAFSKSANSLLALQVETARQTETVREVLGTQSQLLQLKGQLQENLTTLAQVGNFEETVNSLAAAIHLLNSNRRSERLVG